MGDPKKQRKKFEAPRHPWRKDQLEAELRLVGEYGLRNKRELWRYKTMLSQIRGIARALLAMTGEQRARVEGQYLSKLNRLGVSGDTSTLDEILDMDIKDLLERRLQTMVFRNGLAGSIHQARQLISHGHIAVGNRVISIPGYLVRRGEEGIIAFDTHSPASKADHPIRKIASARGPRIAAPPAGMEPISEETPAKPDTPPPEA